MDRGARPGGTSPLDIKALLSVALEQRPRDDVQDRVMQRVALMATATEFARLIFVAPVQGLLNNAATASGAGEDGSAESDDEPRE
ncbi:MAG: hypothetical protein H6711_08165 [Myxococcales bacterium]|nr:hypothetical protein [Myxococcales bacterium]